MEMGVTWEGRKEGTYGVPRQYGQQGKQRDMHALPCLAMPCLIIKTDEEVTPLFPDPRKYIQVVDNYRERPVLFRDHPFPAGGGGGGGGGGIKWPNQSEYTCLA